eukprot:Sdes_comp15278_c0_seq1m4122
MLLGKISSNFFRWNSFVKFTPNFRFASKPSHVYCSTLNLPTFSFRAYSQASSPLSTTTDPSDTKKSEPKRLETKIYRALAAVFGKVDPSFSLIDFLLPSFLRAFFLLKHPTSRVTRPQKVTIPP